MLRCSIYNNQDDAAALLVPWSWVSVSSSRYPGLSARHRERQRQVVAIGNRIDAGQGLAHEVWCDRPTPRTCKQLLLYSVQRAGSSSRIARHQGLLNRIQLRQQRGAIVAGATIGSASFEQCAQ